MPAYTFPNQRVITIHRESAKSDFLGIKNENWQAAARDLGAHALMLYLYLASNANGYNLALSPAAICQAIGMPKSTYRDQFDKLLSRGYLLPTKGNCFDFYEKPQSRHPFNESIQNTKTDNVLNFCEYARDGLHSTTAAQFNTQDITEINNIEIQTNNNGTNIDQLNPLGKTIKPPEERVIRISSSIQESEREITPKASNKEFIF